MRIMLRAKAAGGLGNAPFSIDDGTTAVETAAVPARAPPSEISRWADVAEAAA
jgi:hypothetical protein